MSTHRLVVGHLDKRPISRQAAESPRRGRQETDVKPHTACRVEISRLCPLSTGFAGVRVRG